MQPPKRTPPKLSGRNPKKSPYFEIVKKGLTKLKLYPWQESWIKDESRGRICLKSRQVGFSFVFGVEAALAALLFNKNQLLCSASQDQSEVMVAHARHFLVNCCGIELVRDSEGLLELPNGTTIKALPKNFRTIQGFNGDIYFDEFAWNADDLKIWRVLVPSITAAGGRISIASTPFAKKGKFYELWLDEKEKNVYSKHKIDIYSAIDQGLNLNGQTREQFLTDLADLLDDPDFWPSAYECQFIDDSESYLPYSLIEPCMKLLPDDSRGQDLWLGIDIGRRKDITSITAIGEVENGKLAVRFLLDLENMPYEKQKGVIFDLFRKHNIYRCYIDKTGIGDNLCEDIKARHKERVVGISFTQKSKEQMAGNLKRMIEQGGLLLLSDRKAAAHYTAIKRTATAKGFSYDTERNAEHGHADKFWSLALGLVGHDKRKKRKRSRWRK